MIFSKTLKDDQALTVAVWLIIGVIVGEVALLLAELLEVFP